MGRVTIKDIAEAVGVTPSAVSLALRGSNRVSEATRKRVEEEAERLGYIRDLTGVLLRSTNPAIVGLACDFSQELHYCYYSNIQSRIEKAGGLLVTEDSRASGMGKAIERLLQFRAGVVIAVNPEGLSDAKLKNIRVPVITVGQVNLPGTSLVTSINSTGFDELAAHLAQRPGKLIHIEGPQGASATRRREDLLSSLSKYGLECECVPGGSDVESGFLAANSLIDAGIEDGTALLCYNDQCAEGALVALARAGIKIPERVRVTGFDNAEVSQSKAFAITTIDRGAERIAEVSVELAMARIADPKLAPERRELETKLVLRETA
ncbi:MAG: LacI family transcriptional regulator [Propionibacteriaceae bacterium]|jgi:DNA-binding LacI/PurR family transcriptional regulator|nr:LacI family transcriptional regulator [Propionibacteriaceae bacterium]